MNEFGGGVLSKEKFGFSDLDSNREYLDLLNMPSKKYNISSDKASELFGRIERLVNTCDKELEYQVFGSNCADFVQDMYSRAGLEGDVLEDVYGFRYPQNIFGVYKAITDFHDSISPPSKTQETQKNEPLSYVDLTSQILLGSVVVPYVAAGISSSVKSASEFLYDNIFGKKLEDAEKQVQLEEIDKAKPDLLKLIIAEKKEFEKLYKDIYGENIKIANEEYDERAHKYKSARGEIAIKKVRLLSDVKEKFRNLSRDLKLYTEARKDLNLPEVYESKLKEYRKLNQKIFDSFTSIQAEKAKLLALQESEALKYASLKGNISEVRFVRKSMENSK